MQILYHHIFKKIFWQQNPTTPGRHIFIKHFGGLRKVIGRFFNFSNLLRSIRSDQLLNHVGLFATPWITARQASLSITNSQSWLKLTSIESVMPSSHLILCCPLLLLPPIPPSMSLFQWVNSSHEVIVYQIFGVDTWILWTYVTAFDTLL